MKIRFFRGARLALRIGKSLIIVAMPYFRGVDAETCKSRPFRREGEPEYPAFRQSSSPDSS